MKRCGRPKSGDILTPREWEVLGLLRAKRSNDEIAGSLGVSLETVKSHVSSILMKLGVRDRHAAARWEPTTDHRGKRMPLWAPLTLHWRAVLYPTATLGAVGVAIAGVVFAAVARGPFPVEIQHHNDHAEDVTAAPTEITLTSKQNSVMLFSTGAQPSVRELVDAQGTAFLQWLDGGSRVVGYNWARQDFEILSVDAGGVVRQYATFAPQPAKDRRAEWAHALPGGAAVLLERDDGPPRLYDVATGTMHPFTGPPGQNSTFTASRDGSRLIFNNTLDGKTRVMTSDLDGSHAQVLAGTDASSVGLTGENPVSPDGAYRLMETSEGVGSARRLTDIVMDANGVSAWRMPVPDIVASAIATDVRWAGPGRLLLTQTQPNGHDGLNVITSKFISIPSGVETAAPPELASRLLSLSPDGVHAIMTLGDASAAWERRCALVEIDASTGAMRELAAAIAGPGDFQTVFCASGDWTADGSQAIVSAGGI